MGALRHVCVLRQVTGVRAENVSVEEPAQRSMCIAIQINRRTEEQCQLIGAECAVSRDALQALADPERRCRTLRGRGCTTQKVSLNSKNSSDFTSVVFAAVCSTPHTTALTQPCSWTSRCILQLRRQGSYRVPPVGALDSAANSEHIGVFPDALAQFGQELLTKI